MPIFLQRFFAPFAISGILRVLAGFQALIFILLKVMGPERAASYLDMLSLDFGRILQGQVWRLISFMAVPLANPFSNLGLLWLLFAVMFLFFVNDILEDVWGTNGLNAFFYLGFIGCLLSAIVVWAVRPDLPGSLAFQLPMFFATSCIMAAGTVAPKFEVRLFLFIPVPLALIAALGGLTILLGSVQLFFAHPLLALVPLLCISNYLVWVLPIVFKNAVDTAATRDRRARFESAKPSKDTAFHTCESCGATEISHPDREFRVTSHGHEKCDACRDSSTSAS